MRGFTLIELLIVLLIVSTLFSLVGPVGFHQYERSQILKEREQLYRILENVRLQAVVNRKPLTLYLKGQELVLEGQSEPFLHVFERIKFDEQQLEMNANGFWLDSTVFWWEGEVLWQLKLNFDAIQFTPYPSLKSGNRVEQF